VKEAVVNERWKVWMTDHRADLDKLCEGYWRTWEKARFASMAKNIKPGMTCFDIGTEQGELTAVVALFGGPENMILCEPNPDLWPNIKAVWEANNYAKPKACLVALLSDRTAPAVAQDFDGSDRDGWPVCAYGPIHTARSFRLLNMIEFTHVTPQVTLDDWWEQTKINPDVLNIDVEGAELAILRGGQKMIAATRPLIYVSLHDEMLIKWFPGHLPGLLHQLLQDLGYVGKHIAYDHEDHWLYYDPKIHKPE